ncbi:hypothetical protein HCC61_26000 [Streptomyces sp. HNM0575]|nr:hypothetical protein [Streptomyces sp. HNM0575]
MSRVRLALRVPDLDASAAFHSRLLGAEPAGLPDGCADFAVVEPLLKPVLIEGGPAREGPHGPPGSRTRFLRGRERHHRRLLLTCG